MAYSGCDDNNKLLSVRFSQKSETFIRVVITDLNHFALLLFTVRMINGLNTRHRHHDNASDKTTCRRLSNQN